MSEIKINSRTIRGWKADLIVYAMIFCWTALAIVVGFKLAGKLVC